MAAIGKVDYTHDVVGYVAHDCVAAYISMTSRIATRTT